MNTRFLKQNISILFVIAIFLTPSMVFADAQDFNEVTYVYRSFISDVPADIQECSDIGIPFVPDYASNYDLFSYHSKKTNGKILTENINKIGHVLFCADFSGLALETLFDPYPVFP